VNTDPHPECERRVPEWTNKAARRLEQYEKQQLQPGQSAYVIITNMSFPPVIAKRSCWVTPSWRMG